MLHKRTEVTNRGTYLGDVCSNLDGEVDMEVMNGLRKNKCWASYPAWGFFGVVWFDSKKFHCEVWIEDKPVKVFSDRAMRRVKEMVCKEFGYE